MNALTVFCFTACFHKQHIKIKDRFISITVKTAIMLPHNARNSVKLRLYEASREIIQVGRLPAPNHLPRVNVYLPETIS
jgi:hypothetical protein